MSRCRAHYLNAIKCLFFVCSSYSVTQSVIIMDIFPEIWWLDCAFSHQSDGRCYCGSIKTPHYRSCWNRGWQHWHWGCHKAWCCCHEVSNALWYFIMGCWPIVFSSFWFFNLLFAFILKVCKKNSKVNFCCLWFSCYSVSALQVVTLWVQQNSPVHSSWPQPGNFFMRAYSHCNFLVLKQFVSCLDLFKLTWHFVPTDILLLVVIPWKLAAGTGRSIWAMRSMGKH